MDEKGRLEELLKAWQTPAPRADFEVAVLRRLRATPARPSRWQRWFVEPWEYAGSLGKSQALAFAGAAVALLIVGVALNAPRDGVSTDFGVNSFSTFPRGSFTQAYLEMVGQ